MKDAVDRLTPAGLDGARAARRGRHASVRDDAADAPAPRGSPRHDHERHAVPHGRAAGAGGTAGRSGRGSRRQPARAHDIRGDRLPGAQPSSEWVRRELPADRPARASSASRSPRRTTSTALEVIDLLRDASRGHSPAQHCCTAVGATSALAARRARRSSSSSSSARSSCSRRSCAWIDDLIARLDEPCLPVGAARAFPRTRNAISPTERPHGYDRADHPARGIRCLVPTLPERSPWPALWALVIGFFMILVDTTIVSVANPAIKAALDPDTTNLDNVVWVTSAYLLAYAVPLLITGRLGDRFGPKRIYLIGLVVFTLASLWCGLSGTPRAADHRARRSGARCRAHDAADDGRHHPDLPARPPRRGDGTVGRDGGRRDARRSARGRPAGRRLRLGVDLLHQRPGRHRSRSSWRGSSCPTCRRTPHRFDILGCLPQRDRPVPHRVRPAGRRALRLGRHLGSDHGVDRSSSPAWS